MIKLNFSKINKIKIVIIIAWDGFILIPFLLKLLRNPNIEIVKIFSQDTHYKFLKNYDDYLGKEYNNSIHSFMKILQLENKYEIIKSANNDDLIEHIEQLQVSKVFFFCYGEILRKNYLDSLAHLSINIHPGILPVNKGADPISISYFYENIKPGITLHFMSNNIDDGEIILKKELLLKTSIKSINRKKIEWELGVMASDMVANYLNNNSKKVPIKNSKLSNYFNKFSTRDKAINLEMSFEEIEIIFGAFVETIDKPYIYLKNYKTYIGGFLLIDDIQEYTPKSTNLSYGNNELLCSCKDKVLILKDLRISSKSYKASNKLLRSIFNFKNKNFFYE